jgi:acyl carrier protein
MTTMTSVGVGGLVRAALTASTGTPADALSDDAVLGDIGLDSLDLVELLVSVSDRIAAMRGPDAGAVSEPQVLPWLETVGDLVAFVTTSAAGGGAGRSG